MSSIAAVFSISDYVITGTRREGSGILIAVRQRRRWSRSFSNVSHCCLSPIMRSISALSIIRSCSSPACLWLLPSDNRIPCATAPGIISRRCASVA